MLDRRKLSMLSRRKLERWFPDDEIVVAPESALPDGLSDAPTRRLLADIGAPESFLDVLMIDIVRPVPRIGEVYQRHGGTAPAGTAELFSLGFAGQSQLALDGSSGRLFQVHEEFGSRPMASNLESFLRVLGFVSDEVQKHQRKPRYTAEQFAERLIPGALKQLKRRDPAALPAAEPAWRAFLADVAANSS